MDRDRPVSDELGGVDVGRVRLAPLAMRLLTQVYPSESVTTAATGSATSSSTVLIGAASGRHSAACTTGSCPLFMRGGDHRD